MADNQKPHTSKDSDKKGGKKRKSRSKIRDGVVLRASVIERERERLRRRPRAALYPLLPIMEPTKFPRRQSIRIAKSKKRHRKHCRKRTNQVGDEQETDKPKSGLNSRTRLVTTTSESGGSSLACSKLPPPPTITSTIQCPRCSPLCKPGLLSDWGSIELYADGLLVSDFHDKGVQTMDEQYDQQEGHQLHQHHHHCHHRNRHRMCHHYKENLVRKLEYKHRSSVTSTRSLDDLRTSNVLMTPFKHHRRRRLDVEAGRTGDRDSVSSNNRSRKIVSFIVGSVASFILLMCVALVAVTLRLTPAIDELGKLI